MQLLHLVLSGYQEGRLVGGVPTLRLQGATPCARRNHHLLVATSKTASVAFFVLCSRSKGIAVSCIYICSSRTSCRHIRARGNSRFDFLVPLKSAVAMGAARRIMLSRSSFTSLGQKDHPPSGKRIMLSRSSFPSLGQEDHAEQRSSFPSLWQEDHAQQILLEGLACLVFNP